MQAGRSRMQSNCIGRAGRCLPKTSVRSIRPASQSSRLVVRRCAAASEQSPATSSVDTVPAGCARYTVSLRKPLGIVLEQNTSTGVISVVELREGSAMRDGRVKKGDQLIAVSGVVYESETDYGGATVKTGQKVVRLMVRGETFKTVSAAIGSHPGHMPVEMEFQSCE